MAPHTIQQATQRRWHHSIARRRLPQRPAQTGAVPCRLQPTQHVNHRTRNCNAAIILHPAPPHERIQILKIRRWRPREREIQRALIRGVLPAHKSVEAQQAVRQDTERVPLVRKHGSGAVVF
jgi:hypothetical protein